MNRLPNLLGALSLALTDAQTVATHDASGLSLSACSALLTVAQYPNGNIRDLSAVLGLTHSVTVRLVDNLVQRGLVERSAGQDKRQVALSLTNAGKALRRRIRDARQRSLERGLSDLPSAARAQLEPILSAMLATLTESRNQADHLCRLCDETACGAEDCPVEIAVVRLEAT